LAQDPFDLGQKRERETERERERERGVVTGWEGKRVEEEKTRRCF